MIKNKRSEILAYVQSVSFFSIMCNRSRTCCFLLLLLSGLLTACPEQPQQAVPMIRPVRYQAAAMTNTGALTRTFSGVAKAGLESNLSFKVSGTVNVIAVKVGDVVQQGQIIATLDATDYELQVQQAEAQLAQASAQELNARTQLERTQKLFDKQGTSQSNLDAAHTAHESALAMVRAMEKQVALATSQTAYTRLTAPFDGVISAVHAETNENVQAGMPIVMLTAPLTEPEVEVAMPDTYIAQITQGQTVTVRFNATIDRTFTGIVTEVSLITSKLSATYPVIVTLSESDPAIRPGMVADVTFTFAGEERERILLPSHAVLEDQDGRFVYVAQPGNGDIAVVKRANVTVGDLTAEGFEILAGLTEGQYVITAGVSRITPDMQVKLSAEWEKE